MNIKKLLEYMPEWSLVADNVILEIKHHGEGYIICLDDFNKHGRIIVTGKLPSLHGKPYVWKDFQITISNKKAYEKIASEINSRFLPKYIEKYANIKMSIEHTKMEIQRLQDQIGEIASLLDYAGKLDNSYFQYLKYKRSVLFDFGSMPVNGKVEIVLSLDFGQAKRVAELLKEMELSY